MDMNIRQEVAEYSKGSFEEFWASLKKTEQMIENIGKKQEETDRIVKETALQMKETDKKMGNLYNRFGEMAEHLVAPNIHQRFNELGYHFGAYSGVYKVDDDNGKRIAEIDIMLENRDYLMAIEVKVKPDLDDIEDHLNRLKIVRYSRDRINDKRKVQGAIAGAIFASNVKREVIKAGLFVIEQSGDTMQISIPDGFVPREW